MENSLIDSFFGSFHLTEKERKTMLDLDLFKTYPKGTILLKKGEYSKYNYFVVKGCLRAYYIIGGEEKTTSLYLEEDAIFAESLVHKKSSEYYITCVEDCVLLRSSAKEEQFFRTNFPKMDTLCNRLFQEELAKQQAKFNQYSISTPETRYLNLLKNRPQLLQRVSQYHIASYIGVKPESLSRIKKRISKPS